MFDPTLRSAMRDEVLEFVDQVTRLGDGKLTTLLTTNTTWIRGPIYPLYGLPMQGNAGGSILHKVTLPASERSGIFTTAGVLAKYGHADQSSPVGRGKLISERILCVIPPDPPPVWPPTSRRRSQRPTRGALRAAPDHAPVLVLPRRCSIRWA
jgi:hypothetical protein